MASRLLYPMSMTFNREIHHRRSIRIPRYDYSRPGAYFVTVCTHKRECLLGHIANGQMILNDAGLIAESVWNELPQRCPAIDRDVFIIMPNHIHTIVVVGAQFIAPKSSVGSCRANNNQGVMNHAPTLGKIIRTFKALSTRLVHKDCNPAFSWQRNYYERIIRNEEELSLVREYIVNNPMNWQTDEENPDGT